MHSDFIKETKMPELTEKQNDEELLENIEKSKNYLKVIYNNMKYAENELVDYYAYEVKAEQAKYGYLIKEAKKRKLKEE